MVHVEYHILSDLNPKNCLKQFHRTSTRYVLLVSAITYIANFLIMWAFLTNIDLPYVEFQKDKIFDLPYTLFNSTILIPMIEESLFFGFSSLVHHPIVMIITGSLWSITHLFHPLNQISYSFSFEAFAGTVGVLFIHFKLWRYGFGWISILFHSIYNTLISYLKCYPDILSCGTFVNNDFEFPNFYIFVIITFFLTFLVFWLHKRKEEKDYIKNILKQKENKLSLTK